MARLRHDAERLLAEARAGSPEALGRVFEACRKYLLRVAGRRLDPDLRAKGGASDLVQQTFLEAQRDFGQFAGQSEKELLAWLRRLLLNNVAHFHRHYKGTAKRQARREVALAEGDSAAGPAQDPAADAPSPSSQFLDKEEAVAVQEALARLPEEYRVVLCLRHQEQCTFEEIARRLGRSPSGVRGLWLRAVECLQQQLGESS